MEGQVSLDLHSIASLSTVLENLASGSWSDAIYSAVRILTSLGGEFYVKARKILDLWGRSDMIYSLMNEWAPPGVLEDKVFYLSLLDISDFDYDDVRELILYASYIHKMEAVKILFTALRRLNRLYRESEGLPLAVLLGDRTLFDARIFEAGLVKPPRDISTELYELALLLFWALLAEECPENDVLAAIEAAFLYDCFLAMSRNNPERLEEAEEFKLRFREIYNRIYIGLKRSVQDISYSTRSYELKFEVDPAEIKWLPGDPLPTPFFVVDRDLWVSGVLKQSGSVYLEPLDPWAFLARGTYVPTTVDLGRRGSGKTTRLNALAQYRLEHGYCVLRTSIDDRVQDYLAVLPAKREYNEEAYETLVKTYKLRPRGVEVVGLVIVEDEADLGSIPGPPTKIDRVLLVEDLDAFHLGEYWRLVLKPGRLVTLRYTNRRNLTRAISTLYKSLLLFRQVNKSVPLTLQIDEAKFLASGAVRNKSTQALGDLLAAARGQRVVVDVATHRPAEVAPYLASESHNVLVSDMDKRDLKEVLGNIPNLEFEKEIVNVATSGYMNAYKLTFWINRWRALRVELVRSILPTFQVESDRFSTWEILEREGLTLPSWNDVPRLIPEVLPFAKEIIEDEKALEAKLKKREKKRKRGRPRKKKMKREEAEELLGDLDISLGEELGGEDFDIEI